MREYLFRGKMIANGSWSEGNPKLEQACYKVHYKYKNRHSHDQYRFEVIK